ncbi:AraC family transcriptional regulator [uncultured Robinsoniella sp.]|uniref:AraC family transcriptional regulator n=1 Tax=uncultured Robinsoniella sp. TaxID=904190 RepID=UPI00374FC605
MTTISTGVLPASQIYFHTPSSTAANGFLYPLCIGHFYCDHTYQIRRNSFDSFLAILVIRGSGYVEIDGETHVMNAGELTMLDCYKPHAYGAQNSWEFYWIHFDGITARHYFNLIQNKYPHIFRLSQEVFSETLLPVNAILQSFSCEVACKEIQMSKYITDMLTSILISEEATTTVHRPASGISPVELATAYIRQHYQEAISVDELAGKVSLSPYYFIREFKKETGLTPHSYLTAMRINSAKFYLRTTGKSIKEIGFACGFQSENSFCITFKKQEGMTPTQFRDGEL